MKVTEVSTVVIIKPDQEDVWPHMSTGHSMVGPEFVRVTIRHLHPVVNGDTVAFVGSELKVDGTPKANKIEGQAVYHTDHRESWPEQAQAAHRIALLSERYAHLEAQGIWTTWRLVANPPGATITHHRYISTACAHERPEDCRQSCKYCGAKCEGPGPHDGHDPGSILEKLEAAEREIARLQAELAKREG